MTRKKLPHELLKRGRPTLYTEELAEEICNTIATSNKGLEALTKENPHWPHKANIFVWLRKYPYFRDCYARAKEDQIEVSVDYIQDMLNEPHKYIDPHTGQERIDVPMLRVKIDAIKWQAGKLKPRKYGESRLQEHGNPEMDEDCRKRYAEMDEKHKKEY